MNLVLNQPPVTQAVGRVVENLSNCKNKDLGETMIPDRSNPDSAAEVIDALIPKSSQKVCLEFLANSINIAHGLSPNRWGVTLKSDLVRLNVGNIEVIAIYSGTFRCILDLDTIPENVWKDKIVDLWINEDDPEDGFYKSVPNSVICNIPIKNVKKVLPLIQNSHHVLVENAAETRRHAMTKGAHSPAVIDYLSSYLGREIPGPKY